MAAGEHHSGEENTAGEAKEQQDSIETSSTSCSASPLKNELSPSSSTAPSQSAPPPPALPVPPDGGWLAWSQVLASFLINFNNWGLVNSFGVFQAFYEVSYLASSSESKIAWIGSLQGALLLLVGVLSGPVFDVGKFHILVSGASLSLVFSVMMLSISRHYYSIILTQGVLLGTSCGLLYTPSVALMPLYFARHRGLAIGVATAGGSLGGMVYPVVFRSLLNSVGFPWATRVIGFIALATLIPANLLIKPLPRRPARRLFEATSLKDPYFLLFWFAGVVLYFGIITPLFISPTFLRNSVGASSNAAFYLLAVFNAGQLIGRILPGWYGDRPFHRFFGPEGMILTTAVSGGVLRFSWIAVHSIGGFVPWALIFGFLSGVTTVTPALALLYICPELTLYGTRLGMLYSGAGIGFLVSAPVALACNQSTGGFLGSQIWTGSTLFAVAVLFFPVFLKARKVRLFIQEKKRKEAQ